jgi:hypothetical protein
MSIQTVRRFRLVRFDTASAGKLTSAIACMRVGPTDDKVSTSRALRMTMVGNHRFSLSITRNALAIEGEGISDQEPDVADSCAVINRLCELHVLLSFPRPSSAHGPCLLRWHFSNPQPPRSRSWPSFCYSVVAIVSSATVGRVRASGDTRSYRRRSIAFAPSGLTRCRAGVVGLASASSCSGGSSSCSCSWWSRVAC